MKKKVNVTKVGEGLKNGGVRRFKTSGDVSRKRNGFPKERMGGEVLFQKTNGSVGRERGGGYQNKGSTKTQRKGERALPQKGRERIEVTRTGTGFAT